LIAPLGAPRMAVPTNPAGGVPCRMRNHCGYIRQQK
jgi:hypothetical protein